MSPEEAVLARLEMIGALTALVSTRIYMLKLPQQPTLPAVRVQRISNSRDQHLRGPGYPAQSRVQVDAFVTEASGADPYAAVIDVAAAIRGDGLGDSASGLWGWIGDLGSPALHIHNVDLLADTDPSYEADELRLWRVRQDYMVHWTQR